MNAEAATALIVGASRGIGLELARQYSEAGWIVHATTRSPEQLGALGEISGNITLHQLEVTSADDLHRLQQELDTSPIDVLIHGAGVYQNTPRDVIMAVNAKAPIRVVEALKANVATSDQRKIGILTSQLGARRGRTGSLGDYGDSKAALNDSFRQQAQAWEDEGVHAIVIHPGWVSTDMGGAGAPVSVFDSASGIRRLMAGLTPEMHGRFWTWDGREHPW